MHCQCELVFTFFENWIHSSQSCTPKIIFQNKDIFSALWLTKYVSHSEKKRPTDFSPRVLYPFFTCLLTGQTGLWAHAQTTVLWKFVERDLVWLMTCKPYFEYESSFLCCNPPGKSGGPVKPLVQSINRSSNVWLVPCKMVHVTVTKLCHPETGPRKAQTETKNNI